MSAYVSIRQHMSDPRAHLLPGRLQLPLLRHSAYVSIRQHTSAYVSIRQHTSAYASIRQFRERQLAAREAAAPAMRALSIRQHTSAYVSIRQHTSASGRLQLQLLFAIKQPERGTMNLSFFFFSYRRAPPCCQGGCAGGCRVAPDAEGYGGLRCLASCIPSL
jgi:hypothetical protein